MNIEQFYQKKFNKFKKKKKKKLNSSVLFVLLESSKQVGFHKFSFSSVGSIELWIYFVTKNSTKLQNLVLEGEIWILSLHLGQWYMPHKNKWRQFVCFIYLSHWITLPHVVVLILLEIYQRIGVDWNGFIMFRCIMQELLNIDKIFIRNSIV
jgi:hypothetical protein